MKAKMIQEALKDRLGPKSQEDIEREIDEIISRDPIKGYSLSKENEYEEGVEKSLDIIPNKQRLLSVFLNREAEELPISDVDIEKDGTIVIKGNEPIDAGAFDEKDMGLNKLNLSDRTRFTMDWKVELKQIPNSNEYHLKFEEIASNKEIPEFKSVFQYEEKIEDPFEDFYEKMDKYFELSDPFHKKELKKFIENL